jgi:4-hydroxy-4-methyl-2-oxoglutarate aldolase
MSDSAHPGSAELRRDLARAASGREGGTLDPLRDFDWTTPFIADACAQLQLPVRLGPPHIKPIRPTMKVVGPARPAKHAGSTDVFLEAIAAASPGDVLVIDNVGRLDEACIGDLVAAEAHVAGLAGILVWGAHRDTAAIEGIGIPVWSLGTCPAGPQELRVRSAHAMEAASLGGHVTVTRDDYVFADIDGIVVVAGAHLTRVASAARDIATREQAQAQRLIKGERLKDQLKLTAYVARRQSEPAYTFRDHIRSLGGAIEN